jgi:dolichol-phosphate mannosyltransferase
VPGDGRTLPAPNLAARVRTGLLQPANWLQLVRFGLVGVSGYAVNIATFAVCTQLLATGHRAGAVVAFLVAVSNNFVWNRHWTFRAGAGAAHRQAVRFLSVSVFGFAIAFLALEVLVVGVGLPEVPAQALAVLVAMPVNFLGNRLWTFSEQQ